MNCFLQVVFINFFYYMHKYSDMYLLYSILLWFSLFIIPFFSINNLIFFYDTHFYFLSLDLIRRPYLFSLPLSELNCLYFVYCFNIFYYCTYILVSWFYLHKSSQNNRLRRSIFIKPFFFFQCSYVIRMPKKAGFTPIKYFWR